MAERRNKRTRRDRRSVSPRSLANLRPWKPGESGNPSGRTAGVSAFVKERVGESGDRLILGLEAIAFGTAADHRRVFGVTRGLRVSTKDRREAIAELLDRGWGKARQAVDLDLPAAPMFTLPANTMPDLGNGPRPFATNDATEGPVSQQTDFGTLQKVIGGRVDSERK